MVDPKRRTMMRQAPLRPPPVANSGARLVFTPPALTWWQKLRRKWNSIAPHTSDIATLFITTGRHQFRINWRHPLAIPLVLAIVVLSPLLLVLVSVVFIAGKVDAWRRDHANKGSNGG